jgi:hypothetical protein
MGQAETEQEEQDRQNGTSTMGQAQPDRQNGSGKTGQPKSERQNGTGRTGQTCRQNGQAETNCQERSARTGLLGQDW